MFVIFADTYPQAMRLAKLAEETSNLEDEYEGRSRNVKRPRRFLSSESDSDDSSANPPKSKVSKSKATNSLQLGLPVTSPLTKKTFMAAKGEFQLLLLKNRFCR